MISINKHKYFEGRNLLYNNIAHLIVFWQVHLLVHYAAVFSLIPITPSAPVVIYSYIYKYGPGEWHSTIHLKMGI